MGAHGGEVEKLVSQAPPVSFQGKAWRVHWREVLATDWRISLRSSGRYHRGRDLFPDEECWAALYTSLAPEVAIWEMVRRSAARNLDYLMNNVLSQLDVSVARVIDLSEHSGRDLSGADLTGPNTSLCQEIAAFALSQGCEALLVPSAALHGKNLVILPDNLSESSTIQVVHSTPLPLDLLNR